MSKQNKIPKDDTKGINTKRKKEIRKLLSDRYLIRNNERMISFISQYVDCESTAKKIIQYYKNDKGQKLISSNTLQCDEIVKAVRYFNIQIEPEDVVAVFRGSTGTRNFKTPRQLRNGLFHEKSTSDFDEIELRYDDLSDIMVKWIDSIKKIEE